MTVSIEDALKGYSTHRAYFEITVEAPTLDADAQEERKGFIDPMKAWEYSSFDETLGSLEEYKSKGRGYIRWRNLALQLSQFGVFYMNVLSIDGVTAATDTPTKVKFTMGYEQPESIFCYVDDSEYVAGDSSVEKLRNGKVIFKGIKALKRIVAKSLLMNSSEFVTIFNPTVNDSSYSPSLQPYGMQDVKLDVLPCCNSNTSITTLEGKVAIKEIIDPLIDGGLDSIGSK